MVDAVSGRLFLMNRHDGLADVVRRYDVDFIVRAQGKNRHLRQNMERLNHLELRSLLAAAVAENDGGAENCLGHIGQELIRHVFAEFLGARIGIVIRARPIDRGLFRYDFIFPFARNRNRGNVRIAAKAVAILPAARELNDFECASQVDVQALLLRFAVQ